MGTGTWVWVPAVVTGTGTWAVPQEPVPALKELL